MTEPFGDGRRLLATPRTGFTRRRWLVRSQLRLAGLLVSWRQVDRAGAESNRASLGGGNALVRGLIVRAGDGDDFPALRSTRAARTTSSGSMRETALKSMPWREWNSVRTMPGQTTCTRTPVPSSSLASLWVKVTRNDLLAAYTARTGRCGPSHDPLNASSESHVDHRAEPAREHPREDRAGQQHRSEHIQLHQLLRSLVREFGEGHVVRERGVVNQQLNGLRR